MSKYLVCSDIHGEIENFREALLQELPLDGVLIAGDLELRTGEIESVIWEAVQETDPSASTIPPSYIVAGNNDGWTAPELPKKIITKLEGHTIFLCHGHRFGVPRLNTLWVQAKKSGADIAIFGHTHRYQDAEHFGVRFLNPGKLGYNFSGLRSTYMILTFLPDGSVNAEKRLLPERPDPYF